MQSLGKILPVFDKVFVILGKFIEDIWAFFADLDKLKQFFWAKSHLSKSVWAILHLPKS